LTLKLGGDPEPEEEGDDGNASAVALDLTGALENTNEDPPPNVLALPTVFEVVSSLLAPNTPPPPPPPIDHEGLAVASLCDAVPKVVGPPDAYSPKPPLTGAVITGSAAEKLL
jgi:hypothetical protein